MQHTKEPVRRSKQVGKFHIGDYIKTSGIEKNNNKQRLGRIGSCFGYASSIKEHKNFVCMANQIKNSIFLQRSGT
ncbi:hypothetical protein BPOR_1263g00040 [Botrytis porri]|uniref:Uncharacterized protein n=1 Tax=Botrytis porri TaxID=87229 RepID=A0A4Z1KCG0_9HELO|nr:hypothetical protein BPOR_1263g00040 [Botrytis porri]